MLGFMVSSTKKEIAIAVLCGLDRKWNKKEVYSSSQGLRAPDRPVSQYRYLAPSTESRLLSGCSSLSCSPSTGDVEAGMSGIEASLSYRSDFKANLSYMIPSLKTQTRKATSSQPSGISTFPMMVSCKLLKPTASLGTRNPISLFWHPHPPWLPLISQEDFTFLPWFFLSLFYKNNALFSYVVKSCYRIWLSNCISCLSVSSMLLPTLN